MSQHEAQPSTPLNDIKVLELGQLIAGPYCGQVLADFGAQVIKVEPPGKGDAMRQWGAADSDTGEPLWWNVIGRNKQSLTLDLRQARGQEVLRELAKNADVIIENFRPGTMERWGLSYDVLSQDNPGLVMVRVTGFGQDGPYASRAGFASVCEAMGGLRYLSGYPDRPPVRVGISIGDTLAGLHAALGTMMALHQRERTGHGQVVDSSIFESVLAMMESLIPEFARAGKVRERSGSFLSGIAPPMPTRPGTDVTSSLEPIKTRSSPAYAKQWASQAWPTIRIMPRTGLAASISRPSMTSWRPGHASTTLSTSLTSSRKPASLQAWSTALPTCLMIRILRRVKPSSKSPITMASHCQCRTFFHDSQAPQEVFATWAPPWASTPRPS